MITARFSGILVALSLLLTLPAILLAGTLDDYYLARFGESGSQRTGAMILQRAPVSERCGTPLRRNLKRDWNLLERSTRKSLAKYLARPVLSGTETTVDSPSGRFRIHYATSGADAATLDWATTTAQIFDDVYGVEVQQMGYRSPPTVSPGVPYDIYLQDRASFDEYGYTMEIGPVTAGSLSYSAFTVVDKSFSSSLYAPYSPLESLQVTAAHEFHHSIQFGYNYYFDIWYGEATSTWLEDELYDGVNQLYDYLPASFANSTLSLNSDTSTSTGGGYGRWLFNRHLAEQHGTTMLKRGWEALALIPAPATGGDIPMLPVLDTVLTQDYSSTLFADFIGYVRLIYTRKWLTHTTEVDPPTIFIPKYVPFATYTSYPVVSSSLPVPGVTLPHYSYAFFQLPATSSGVTVTVSQASGLQVTAFRALAGATTSLDEYQPVQSGGQATIYIPGKAATGEIVLLICNPTAMDNLFASFTGDLASSTVSLTVTLGGNGSGTVTSIPAGIACSSGLCSSLFTGGDTVALVAAPGVGSLFSSWGEGCSGSGACSLTLTANALVAATFTSPLPVRIGPISYPNLQSAYDAATSGDVIMLKEGLLAGSLQATAGKIVTVKGGYSPSYAAYGTPSIIQGVLMLGQGSVILDDVAVR
jgi:hypothetical protein